MDEDIDMAVNVLCNFYGSSRDGSSPLYGAEAAKGQYRPGEAVLLEYICCLYGRTFSEVLSNVTGCIQEASDRNEALDFEVWPA